MVLVGMRFGICVKLLVVLDKDLGKDYRCENEGKLIFYLDKSGVERRVWF